ncbi:MAG: hypothetical protein MK185_05360 [Saccharospirillaceae bacterium]|nr:hypothetical protein [Saccharospirillaceae bacterium]
MAKKNLPENIENKIAFFNGSMICFGYLNGKTEYLLPRPHDRKSLGQWSLSDIKLASSMNDGVVEEYFAEPLDEHYIKIKRTLNRKAPKLLDVFQLHNFLVLSKKAKAIVDEFENGVHQFSKLEFVSRDGGVIPGEYFAMIPLRFIKMQEVSQDLPNIVEYFEQPSPSDSMVYDYLFNISEHAEIRSYLLDKGVWSMYGVPELIFVSGRLISKLKECDCTGLKKFTRIEKAGQGEVVYYV